MDFLELATARYSVRSFDSRPVEEAVLQRILQAGMVAPTACNNQPQRILVIRSEEALARLKDCTRCHFNAPLALLICCHREEQWTRRYDGRQSGEIDAAIVTTHMMLEATALGVGSTWVMHFDPAAMRSAFYIPEELIPVALLPLGYPAADAVPLGLHTACRPAEELIQYDSF